MTFANTLSRAAGRSALSAIAPLAYTQRMARLETAALRLIDQWLSHTQRPLVSVSGGKDSTLLLQLVRQIHPDVPALSAVGPSELYLPGQLEYRNLTQEIMGGTWHTTEYPYDVEAVATGAIRYPADLKQRRLRAWTDAHHIDGVALGLRAAESRGRKALAENRGAVYMWRANSQQTCAVQVVLPLIEWSADEVLSCLMRRNMLPLNPVYECSTLQPSFERLRDGTFTPRQTADAHGYREWLSLHYPECIEMYDRLRVATKGGVI